MNASERSLRNLLESIGVVGAEPDADGARSLLFDGDLAVSCRTTPTAIVFESRVIVLPSDPRRCERALASLLGRSVAVLRERESVLCLDPRGVTLMLQRSVNTGADASRTVGEALTEFVDSLEFWRRAAEEAIGDPSPVRTGSSRHLSPALLEAEHVRQLALRGGAGPDRGVLPATGTARR